MSCQRSLALASLVGLLAATMLQSTCAVERRHAKEDALMREDERWRVAVDGGNMLYKQEIPEEPVAHASLLAQPAPSPATGPTTTTMTTILVMANPAPAPAANNGWTTINNPNAANNNNNNNNPNTVVCTVPVIATGAQSWSGGATCFSGSNQVPVNTDCQITAVPGFSCTSPGICGANGQFATPNAQCQAIFTPTPVVGNAQANNAQGIQGANVAGPQGATPQGGNNTATLANAPNFNAPVAPPVPIGQIVAVMICAVFIIFLPAIYVKMQKAPEGQGEEKGEQGMTGVHEAKGQGMDAPLVEQS